MGRALVPGLGVALGFGIAFGYIVQPGPLALAAAVLALGLAAWRRSVVAVWAAAFALGLSLPVQNTLPAHLDFQLPSLREVTGRVLDVPEPRARNVSFTLAVETLPVKLLAYVPHDPPIAPGDRVRLVGRWGLPRPEAWRLRLARRGVHGLFWATEVEVLTAAEPGLLGWASHVRQDLLTRIDAALPSRAADLLGALLLGARGRLPEEDEEAFRVAGVAHLLALSGFNVGILAAGGWWLLGLVRLRSAWRYVLLVPAIGFYVLVGGAEVSLVRAGIMFAILGLFWLLWERGWILRKWLDPLQGLAVAAIVVLVIWPWSALDTGFQLSFLATGGILVFLPGWTRSELRKRLPRWARWVADAVAVTLCAQAGAVPVIGTVFGNVAPYGVLANLILVPWTSVILWAGILFVPLAALPLALPLGFLGEQVLVGPYLAVVRWMATLPGASLPVGPGFGLWCLVAALGVCLVRTFLDESRYPVLAPRGTRGLQASGPDET